VPAQQLLLCHCHLHQTRQPVTSGVSFKVLQLPVHLEGIQHPRNSVLTITSTCIDAKPVEAKCALHKALSVAPSSTLVPVTNADSCDRRCLSQVAISCSSTLIAPSPGFSAITLTITCTNAEIYQC